MALPSRWERWMASVISATRRPSVPEASGSVSSAMACMKASISAWYPDMSGRSGYVSREVPSRPTLSSSPPGLWVSVPTP